MAAGQEFNLRWNNHTNNLLQVFMEQLSSEALVDVTLACHGKFIKAHKMVLSACSTYFQEVFAQHSNAQHAIIIMNGFRYEDIKAIVEFMYRGEVKVTEADLQTLLAAAENLQVKGLSTVRRSDEEANGKTESDASSTQPVLAVVGRSIPNVQPDQRRRKRKLPAPGGINSIPVSTPKDDSEGSALNSQTPKFIVHSKSVPANVPEMSSDDMDNNDDLSAVIKIEPPEIRDIDEEDTESGGWDSPKLVIDTENATDISKTSEASKNNFPSVKAGISCSDSPVRSLVVTSRPGPSGRKPAESPGLTAANLLSVSNTLTVKEKIPRPPNAFMIFANEWRKKLASENPSESNKEISIRLGVMWKSLENELKENYYVLAKQANEEHKRKYPDYFYSPKEARLRKKMKQQAMSQGNYDAVHLVKVFLRDEDGEAAAE